MSEKPYFKRFFVLHFLSINSKFVTETISRNIIRFIKKLKSLFALLFVSVTNPLNYPESVTENVTKFSLQACTNVCD